MTAVSTPQSKFLYCAVVGAKLDPDELVAAREVAKMLGLSHASSVTTYLRRYPDFPRPVVELSESRVRLWNRTDIRDWHQERSGRP